MNDHRYDVTIFCHDRAETARGVDYENRNRLVDFAFRHDLRWVVRDADPRPDRRRYR